MRSSPASRRLPNAAAVRGYPTTGDFLALRLPHTRLVVPPSGKFRCSRHTSLYGDSVNLVTRGIMALYTPVKIVVMDCDNGRLFHSGGVCGAQSTAASGNVGHPW